MKQLFLMWILSTILLVPISAKEYKVSSLSCDYRENPIGIDNLNPVFGWMVKSSERNDSQSAYEIIASDNLRDIQACKGNVWRTGKISSSQITNIRYGGKRLKSCTRYYWKIRSYDKNNDSSEWSDIGYWEMGLMTVSDWKACWIYDGSETPKRTEDFYKNDPAPLFRKEVSLEKTLQSARLYISALGYFESFVNGVKVGNAFLEPGWTSYDKEILYTTYDVTEYLKKGTNVLGVTLGNGFYNPLPMRIFTPLREYLQVGRPAFIAQLRLSYTDGSTEWLYSDPSWKTTAGPTIRNNVYLGEHYDARNEIKDWCMSDVLDSEWKQAIPVQPPVGKLTARIHPSVKVTALLKPVRMTETRPGEYVYDFGQNFAGVVRLKVKGVKGSKITIRYGEDIYSDGSLNVMTTVAAQHKKVWGAEYSGEGEPPVAWQEDSYTLNGKGEEVWNPCFTFHGFRYVEITGFPGKPDLETVVGLRLSADLKRTGEFNCSNELINRLMKAVEWTFLSNVFSVQSDCPAREKLGYGGDIMSTSNAFCHMFDMSSFYLKTVGDFRDAARPSGAMTETSPFIGIADKGFGEGSGPIGWQLAFGYIQKMLYDYYGNKRVIEDNYDVFKKQVAFLQTQADSHIIADCISDHETLDARPASLTATAHYYHHVKLLAEFAGLLGKQPDCRYYNELAYEIKRSFIREFYKGDGIYDLFTQTTQAFALYYDLIDESEQKRVFDRLVETVEMANGHIRTGMFATPMILELLSKYGRNDLAYQMVTQTDFPGWGYMLGKAATTIWETWAYSDNVYSQNHPMFGSVAEWVYRYALGIQLLPATLNSVRIAPCPADGLNWAEGKLRTFSGDIYVSWKKEKGAFLLNVRIPVGMTAKVKLPVNAFSKVLEGDLPVSQVCGILVEKDDSGLWCATIGSGNYSLKAYPN